MAIAGTFTPGDVVSFTFTGGVSPSPQTIHTNIQPGDTANSVVTRLSSAFSTNPALKRLGMVSTPITNLVSINIAPLPSVMTVTGHVTGSGSEQVAVGYGGNASAAIGLINNSNRQLGSVSGAYKSGFVVDCLVLEGGDCSDTGGFGEAIALGRKAAIDFYSPANRALNPASRIYSNQTSATTQGLNIRFDNQKQVFFEDSADSIAQFSIKAQHLGATDHVTAFGGLTGAGNEGGLTISSSNSDANFAVSSKGAGLLDLYGGTTPGIRIQSGNVTLPSITSTPGGKQPLCIDTTTKQIYQGTNGSC